MAQAGRAGKADNPALRSEIEQLRRSGLPVPRKDIAERHGVGVATVQAIRAEIDRQLATEGFAGPIAGRVVAEFDGRRLFELRRARILKQDELGKLAVDPSSPLPRRGVSRGEIGHLERGHRKPTLPTLRRLALALGVIPDDLLRLPYRADLPARAILELRDAEEAREEAAQRAAEAADRGDTGGTDDGARAFA